MNLGFDLIPLGRSEVRVSPLGIGTWEWGDRFFWGYGQDYHEADVQDAFRASVQAGINFFDTAEIYGPHTSERLLGRFIHSMGAEANVVVASKFVPLPWRLRRADLLRALRGSLKRLGLKQIDLYQIHFPLGLVSVEARMAALADAVEAGLTRAVGVSNYNLDQMRRAESALAQRGIALASNQVEYSLLERKPERSGLLAECRKLGVTLIAYSPLAKGLLSAKYTPQNPVPGLRGRRYPVEYLALIQPLIGLLREIGQAHSGKTPAQVALNWTICQGTLPIPGVKNLKQAQENAGAIGWRLSDDEVRALNQASDPVALV
ncbi:MAG: aldo/keto reductase [Chloroflexi bacterium]|nr:aldo/keto reductase [Chloroflexota bacterium]MBI3734549.1 aldo/keto reductase [Chloroflexota bacterium]